MDPFVAHLVQLCREHPTRSKWVFVPGHAIGRTIGDRLVLEGPDWANLRFVTPLDLALRMGAPYLVEKGIDPSEDQLGPALIMRLLIGLDEVEIACASEGYSTLLWEKACRYEWPVTLATGLPAPLTRPGRALLGLIEWVEDNFAAGKLRRLLQSGDVKSSEPNAGSVSAPAFGSELILPSPGRAARLLVKANAAWGRATYRLPLTRLATSSRARAKDDISEDEREYRERNAKEPEHRLPADRHQVATYS